MSNRDLIFHVLQVGTAEDNPKKKRSELDYSKVDLGNLSTW